MRMSPRSWQWREKKLSAGAAPASLPTVPLRHWGVHSKQGADLSRPCRALGSWHTLLSAMHQDPWVCWILPQHLPLPAVQCPPSASTEFTPPFSIPTHPGCPWAQNPPAKVAVLILPSGLPIPSQPSSALPSKPRLNSFRYGCSKMFLLTRTHLSLHFSPFTSPAWLPPLTDPSPITPLCSPQI